MTPEQWQSIADWHAAWLEADDEERARLRAQAAAGPAELRAEYDALMSADEAPADFLETPAFVLTAARLAQEATLPPGTAVGPYQIVSLVGHGGMGVVYRARDLRLDRHVALKMLSPVVMPDAAHVERFVQEARLTASVDHINIVKVFDVGVFDGQPYMVIELLDGETLRARLDRGPLDLDEARRVALDLARGLAAAHAAGLVHRDLKPENIVLTRAGVTKILDFGIAKLTAEDADRRRASTLTGILLGTVGYLAPEQVRGDGVVDARADLFAVGSILFEMLSGTRAFACENTVDTLHAILHGPAPDVATARPEAALPFGAIVRRLLAKAPDDRFQSAADLAWALGQGSPEAAGETPAAATARIREPRGRMWLWIAAALVLGLGGWWLGQTTRPGEPTPRPIRFSWTLPAGTRLVSQPAVAPDGRQIAWAGIDAAGTTRLFVRALDAAEARAISGTEGAQYPFWAPDSRALGFFAGGQLKRVPLDSGPPVVLARAPQPRGGAWSPTGVIVFQPLYRDSPLMQIPASGGEPTPVTRMASELGDVTHRYPAFLPDGRHFIYSVVSGQDERRGIYLSSIDGPVAGDESPLFASDSNAVFVPTDDGPGLLLSVTDERLTARRFDPDSRALVGDAWTMDIAVAPATPHHQAMLSASADLLAFSNESIPWGALFSSVGRDGTALRVGTEAELGGFPRMSPDGRLVARTIVDPVRGNPDVWIEDRERGTRLRVTTTQAFDVMPVWSRDGREIAYRSGLLHAPVVGFAAADASGATRSLPCPRQPCEPTDWAPDGRYLVVNVGNAEVWALPLDGRTPAAPLFVEPFPVRDARIDVSGRWIAYVSSESGRPEVSVRSLSGTPRRYRVSVDGGDQPVWRLDGRELFFADLTGRLFSVSVTSTTDELRFGRPERLAVPNLGERHWGTTYDVSRDGRQVFFPHAVAEQPATSFGVLSGWQELLDRSGPRP